MSTTEDLSIQPYMFEPESEPERDENEDDEPAEQRLHMDVSQWCVLYLHMKLWSSDLLPPCRFILINMCEGETARQRLTYFGDGDVLFTFPPGSEERE